MNRTAGRIKRHPDHKFLARLRALALALVLVGGPGWVAWAAGTGMDQGNPTPPPAAPAPDTSGDIVTSGTIDMLSSAATSVTDNLKPILAAGADIPADLASFADRLLDPGQGPFSGWLIKLAAALAVAIGSLLLPGLLAPVRRRLVHADTGRGATAIGAFLGDVAGLVALVAIFYVVQAFWFSDTSVRSVVAISLYGGLIHWRITLLPVDVLLRPREPEARLVMATSDHAAQMRRLASCLLGFIAFSQAALRAFLLSGVPTADVRLLALLAGLANAGFAFYFVENLHRMLSQRTTAPTAPSAAASSAEAISTTTLLQRIWYPLALTFVLVVSIAWLLGVVLRALSVYFALVDTGAILLGVLILQSVAATWLNQMSPTGARLTPGNRKALWRRLFRRCLAVALWTTAAALIAEIWLGRLARVLPAGQWQAWRGSVISAALALYVAYVLWQIVLIHTDHRAYAAQTPQATGHSGPVPVASRIQTMMPVVRIFMLVLIALVAAVAALSSLGVDTTSLIAGASIFGLAISFGSQSLVHDVVSGIFFMADDAFRIGEYIDTGKAKGTVEGMSIRSLRLRHQNGQIHTIPFGQIQQVTNFSRDWITVKFNLTLNLETDLDKLRKTVKRIGAEMLEDPEIASELIEPLKLQGVTDIGTAGLVIRLKFTARPVQPALVQRDALRRITMRFREAGIGFANSNVTVQTLTGPAVTEEDVKNPLATASSPVSASTPETTKTEAARTN